MRSFFYDIDLSVKRDKLQRRVINGATSPTPARRSFPKVIARFSD